MRAMWIFTIILLAAGITGCKPDASSNSDSQASEKVNSIFDPTLPNQELRKVTLWIGSNEIEVEAAITPLEIATGFMFRDSIKEDSGMLFVFPVPREVGFYMKNVTVPLTAAYINREGKIVEIHNLEPMNEVPIVSKEPNIQFVLEMKQGWFTKNGLTVGALVTTDRGALALQLPRGSYFQ